MNDPGSVTISILVYRRISYLSRCLQAVLAQRYEPLEIIVSDDAANPETAQLVASFKDPRLRYRQNTPTLGITANANQCLAEARGEYFMLLSDDDLIDPNYVAELAAAFAACPGAMAGMTRAVTIDEEGETIRRFDGPTSRCCNGQEFLEEWLWGGQALAPTLISMCMRTDAARRAGGLPPFAGGSNAENGLVIALALMGDVVFAPASIFYYRVYRASYGLSTSYEMLAESAAQMRDYVANDPVVAELMAQIPPAKRERLKRGVARMLARQYMTRLQTVYFGQMTPAQQFKALGAYRADTEFLKAVPYLLGKMARGMITTNHP